MIALAFLPDFIRFNPVTHSVHVPAQCEGHQVLVMISSAAIEHLAGTRGLDEDKSVSLVVQNKDKLQHAAEVALARLGAGAVTRTSTVTVEAFDLRQKSPFRSTAKSRRPQS
jgi:hypothetical protein